MAELSAWQWAGAGIAALLVGLSKAGFGVGAGILAIPLATIVLGPERMLAVMVLILITGDIFALVHYPGKLSRRNLLVLVPGLLAGIMIGALALEWFQGLEDGQFWLERLIGVLCIGFVALQAWRGAVARRRSGAAGPWRPRPWHGVALGTGAGIASTLAHVGGPLVAFYLLPQQLGRQVYVGTVVRYFFIGNMVKLIPYTRGGLMTLEVGTMALALVPCVLVGSLIGVRLNRKFSDRAVRVAVYCLALAVGLWLLFSPEKEGPERTAAARSFETGLEALDSGRYGAAERAFDDAADLAGPWQPAALLNRGIALYRLERCAEAERVLARAARIGGGIIPLRASFNRGNCAYREGRLAEAVEWYECAAEGCRAALAEEGEATAPHVRELLARARTNLSVAQARLVAEEDRHDGPGQEGGDGGGGDADGADASDIEGRSGTAGAPTAGQGAAAGGGQGTGPGLRSISEVLADVQERDTGPVLRPSGSARRDDGGNW